ncbi:RNA methyltransferase [Rhodoplanes sp. TEM]|uniref:RNA methyltransferase n=1 Tax=Rhodoplanes tepidamans TaxID=200616 RepID=A0ABT5J826_RHOTP|nr:MULTISPECIES: RNA methyltransferase [Rhodoplanes]MDC7785449.1 RNA methyltransferase [Rhodoplanes tepidamans]MDC7985770.1 RNA methyltransferase [Rhodoplanes sp. TEM]MDQ0353097.1 23S rRNA (uracil1939-C5)-methyltransferase [Rhodoplanes tepidamans]
MTERLTIATLGRRGDGVVDGPAFPIYVPYALPGETVEVEAVAGHPDRRRLVRVEVPSPDRIAPICPHFGVCGGCATQHLAAAPYLSWKRGLLVEALRSAGIETPVGDLVDAHGEGRRRITLHARRGTRDILQVGFAAQRAHEIVPIDRCPVTAPGLAGAIEAAWAIAETLQPLKKPLDIQVTATDAGLDVDVRGSGPLNADRARALAAVSDHHRLARLTRHGELVAQRVAPTVGIGRAVVALPPGPFLQATAAGEAQLARLVDAHVGEAKSVVDLFAGLGPFALRLAERARVRAVEIDAAAVAALAQAARTTPGLKPVTAEARDLFRRPLVAQELAKVDAVVLDPPRQGAEAQARALAASRVPLVVAVSCNSATFARDAALLIAGGYRLTDVTPVDQFRYSYHVEIVAKFVR